jgi:phosphoribosylformylglycinamidine cyclo-ligase
VTQSHHYDTGMSKITYKDAGVDLERNQQAMRMLPPLIERTRTPRVMPLDGGFSGLFQLMGAGHSYTDPVLVSGTDGVGTKIKVAIEAGKYDSIGIDLVAMCVNDCLCLGAEPLFFLDYIAMPQDDPALLAELVAGVSAGCVESGAALLGGETAVMPDLYAAGDFDMAGFCVGVAEREQLVDGTQAIRAGDAVIGLASSGFHSNGFSLIRKVVFESAGLSVSDVVDDLGRTVGEELLEPTRIYKDAVVNVLSESRQAVHGMAHITGGGFGENLERILPENCRLQVKLGSWDVPACFDWLQALGPVPRDEMYRVFNMGIGYVLIVDGDAAEGIHKALAATGVSSWTIGEVTEAERGVDLVE